MAAEAETIKKKHSPSQWVRKGQFVREEGTPGEWKCGEGWEEDDELREAGEINQEQSKPPIHTA